MDKEERKFFERMSKALERVADVMEKQQPSKANQVLTTVGAVVMAGGIFNIIDLIIKWLKGG
jgi:hypothetical protein